MVSEVVGVGATVDGLLRGVRRDPLEIRANAKVLKAADKSWSVANPNAKNGVAPSKINHSSIPFPEQRDRKTEDNNYSGATIEFAEQLTTLSLIALRRLKFPTGGKASLEIDAAGRAVLAALGLCAATLAFESGMGLRSRCLLWPEAEMNWELLEKPGKDGIKPYSLTGDESVALLNKAVSTAKKVGLAWEDAPIELVPQDKLVELVRLSQLEATKEEDNAK